MGLFDKIRKIIRKGGALPNEHGPAVSLPRDVNGRWILPNEAPKAELPKVEIRIVPATTSDRIDCVCGSGKCKCEENKIAYAKAVAEKQKAASKTKPKTDSENTKSPAKKVAPKNPSAKKKPKSN
jgi:hypothetical protein